MIACRNSPRAYFSLISQKTHHIVPRALVIPCRAPCLQHEAINTIYSEPAKAALRLLNDMLSRENTVDWRTNGRCPLVIQRQDFCDNRCAFPSFFEHLCKKFLRMPVPIEGGCVEKLAP